MFDVFLLICGALFLMALFWAYLKDYKARPEEFKANLFGFLNLMFKCGLVFVAKLILYDCLWVYVKAFGFNY